MVEINRKNMRMLICLPALFFLIFLGGCANYSRVVADANRLPLTQGRQEQGTFSNDNISLQYGYELRGEELSMEGRISGGRGIDFLKIDLLFLDQNGRVISGKFIYSSAYRTYAKIKREGEFARTLNVPAGTAGISFDFYVEHRVKR